MATTITDFEIIQSLDFNIEIVCESKVEECDRTAMWYSHSKCCNLCYPICDEHRVRYEKWFEWAIKKFSYMRCRVCKTVSNESLYYNTPINIGM